jgi:two-component system, chemotaxis family, response regulator PixG
MNSKIDPAELLLTAARLKQTGCLELSQFTRGDAASKAISWRVYLHKGQLQYVDCSIATLAQLKCCLIRQGWKSAAASLQDPKLSVQENSSEQAISWLLDEKHINDTQFLELISAINQDSLEPCLWLNEGTSCWHEAELIPLWIRQRGGDALSLNVVDLVNFLQQKLRKWQKCTSKLVSPHQRPYFLNYRDIDKEPSIGILSEKVLRDLGQVMRTGLSFRQLAHFINRDELYVGQVLSPYIQQEIIHLRKPLAPLDLWPEIPRLLQQKETDRKEYIVDRSTKVSKIVCIDDSRIILQEMQRFLKEDRFKITMIDDPIQASSAIFRIEPDLILLDITMPKINGYTLCRLLRNSDACKDIPIIMVTGNTGLVDKAKAKLAGATDYLTKPFTRMGLTAIVEKYLT